MSGLTLNFIAYKKPHNKYGYFVIFKNEQTHLNLSGELTKTSTKSISIKTSTSSTILTNLHFNLKDNSPVMSVDITTTQQNSTLTLSTSISTIFPLLQHFFVTTLPYNLPIPYGTLTLNTPNNNT